MTFFFFYEVQKCPIPTSCNAYWYAKGNTLQAQNTILPICLVQNLVQMQKGFGKSFNSVKRLTSFMLCLLGISSAIFTLKNKNKTKPRHYISCFVQKSARICIQLWNFSMKTWSLSRQRSRLMLGRKTWILELHRQSPPSKPLNTSMSEICRIFSVLGFKDSIMLVQKTPCLFCPFTRLPSCRLISVILTGTRQCAWRLRHAHAQSLARGRSNDNVCL